MGIFLFKQKTAYEMRISDWSSDVCSSDLLDVGEVRRGILGLEIAPALMRPARLRHHRNQFGLTHDAAVGPLVIEARIFQADDRAAHGGIALDDPVERTAVQRPEERRGGQERGSTGRSRRAPEHEKKKQNSRK